MPVRGEAVLQDVEASFLWLYPCPCAVAPHEVMERAAMN
jgi:hypothetical protein